MKPSIQDVIEAVETLDGLQPSWYREILENGPRGDEEYTLYGDDLGAVIHAIYVIKTHFGVDTSIETTKLASPNRTVIE
jgi:hypothetical protein